MMVVDRSGNNNLFIYNYRGEWRKGGSGREFAEHLFRKAPDATLGYANQSACDNASSDEPDCDYFFSITH